MKKSLIELINSNPTVKWFYKTSLGRKRNKTYLDALKKLEKLQNLEPKRKREENERELFSILKHAYETTDYYSTIINEFNLGLENIDDFKKIPILTKKIIKENSDRLISIKYKKTLIKRFTGGSTGEPLAFYSDKYGPEKDRAHHTFIYNKILAGKPFKLITIANRKLEDKSVNSKKYWDKFPLTDAMFGNYIFSTKYLNSETVEDYLNKMVAIKPSLIRGYPSSINFLANFIIKNRDRFYGKITPSGIIVTSELCTSVQQKNIENAFCSKVFFEYGHKEISAFCYTAPNEDEYQSSPTYCYLEVLDEDGNDVEIGEIGRIVTTGFNNYGMPFIRYDTGDLGQLSERNGGVVRLSKIIGRSQDFLIDNSGKKHYLIGTVYQKPLEAFNHIYSWQLKQSKRGIVDVLIVPKDTFTEKNELELSNTLEMFQGFQFNFLYVKDIPKTKMGKHLFVKREI